MRLININIGIKINNTAKVIKFLQEQDADIIALQETTRIFENSVYEQFRSGEEVIKAIGENYPYRFFGPLWITNAIKKDGKMHRDFGGHIEQGNEIMSKIPIVEATNEHYYKTYSYALDWTNWQTEDHGRAVVITELDIEGKRLQVLNLHGIWTANKKGDERTIKQCEYILAAAKRKDIPTIITGDFNLAPETPSIQILDQKFRNLITEYGIKSTRPDFNDGTDTGKNVVDYIFINDGIQVNDFQVINNDVSDHLPLKLEFEIRN